MGGLSIEYSNRQTKPCHLGEFVEAETFNQASVKKSDMNKVKNSEARSHGLVVKADGS